MALEIRPVKAKEMEALAESLRRPVAVSGRELREEERFVRLDETLAPSYPG